METPPFADNICMKGGHTMVATNRVPPGFEGKKQYIIVDENGHAFEWKSNAFCADKCTTYIKRASMPFDAVQQSFPDKKLKWAVL